MSSRATARPSAREPSIITTPHPTRLPRLPALDALLRRAHRQRGLVPGALRAPAGVRPALHDEDAGPHDQLTACGAGLRASPGERIQLDLALIGQGAVGGTVTDLAGNPVAGASVLASSLVDAGLGGNAVTDANGQYLIQGLTVGGVSVRVAKGIALGRNSGVIQRAGTTATVNVVLDAGTVSVSGRVQQVADGQAAPLPGVVVVYSIDNVATGYAWTQADGSYQIDGMPAGSFRVSVQGHAASRTGYAFAGDAITGFDLVEEILTSDETETVLGDVAGIVVLPDGDAGAERRRGARHHRPGQRRRNPQLHLLEHQRDLRAQRSPHRPVSQDRRGHARQDAPGLRLRPHSAPEPLTWRTSSSRSRGSGRRSSRCWARTAKPWRTRRSGSSRTS